ncbi:MAG: monovalent cation/H(+) antiporter subunit G [Thermodesulfobacteriota bacterium]|nr:monovalent cation/H(+) antiporter subunit G [Thermodesulfobacteriota bacterium]
MTDVITAILLICGGIFAFVASLGIVRLPDTLMRMHAATKAGALGAGLIFLGLAFFSNDPGITLRALAAAFFLLLTAPVAAHLIGRAAYCSRVNLWHKTWIDEFATVCDWRQATPQNGQGNKSRPEKEE